MNRRKPHVTTSLLARRAQALRRYLPAAIRGDHHGVHQARVATRRLREAVPVLTTGIKGAKTKKARVKIRRLTRALGTVRELDVTLHVLDELARRPGIPRNALEDVRAHVMLERDDRRALMLERLDEVNAEKLGRRLRAVGAVLSESGVEKWREVLAVRIVKRARRFSAAVQEAGLIYSPERLHQVRIAAKKLRYALELAQELSGSRATARVRTLKQAQDLLGRMNDLEVLIARIRAVQGSSEAASLRLSADLDRLVRRLETECRQLHGQYMASRRKLLAICDYVAAAGAPDGAAISAA